MPEPLKSCPFCGSDNVRNEAAPASAHFATCLFCYADGPTARTLEEAGERWNRRPMQRRKAVQRGKAPPVFEEEESDD